MRQCTVCSMHLDDSAEVCPIDGAPLTDRDPLVGAVVGGKYRIDALVGEGGMGAVYRATQVSLDRTVAVKVIRGNFLSGPSAGERFKREALAVARLKHPHIVTIYDYGVSPDAGAYLVMEFVDGATLRQRISRSGRLSARLAVDLMRQVCWAVQAAHEAGVLHRDLKPDNVLIEATPDGPHAKVLDFGVAKFFGGDAPAGDMVTLGGTIIGTAAYMSPEQCNGGRLDPRSDVYSLGCVLYEMVTGRPPFGGPDRVSILRQQVSSAPERLRAFVPGVPAALEAAVFRALAKRPDARYQTAEAFARALEGAAEPQTDPGHDVLSTATVSRFEDTADSDAGAATEVLPNNLPQPLTTFVGREREIAGICRALASTRLLTLAGPAGIGKTRLALQAATGLLYEYSDGVWQVELAPLTDAGLVPQAVASALGVREAAGQSLTATVCGFLRPRATLLVLDNCEHVVEGCASLVDEVLRACPFVKIVATSREVLGLAGEAVWQVPALSVPAPGAEPSLEELRASDAVALFAERARLSNPRFELTERNARAVARLCAELEGIALALELAAARTKTLAVEQILARLTDRFRLLTGGSRTVAPRRRTLRAAIDWSYDMLPEEERALLRALSVFVGGWTLSAAEEVVGCRLSVVGKNSEEAEVFAESSSRTTDNRQPTTDNLLDLLTHLIDKSLVMVEDADGLRYRMLETVRQYAGEKLEEAGEGPRLRDAHRDWFLALAEAAEPAFRGPEESAWLARLEAESGNLRAALEWSVGRGEEAGLRLCAAMARFWDVRGQWAEGQRWLDKALAAGSGAPPALRAKALNGAGLIARHRGDLGRARDVLEESLALRRALGEPRDIALTLNALGNLLELSCEGEAAVPMHEESLELFREAGDRRGVGMALSSLGLVALDRFDYDEARARYEESLAISREAGDVSTVGVVLHNLGDIAHRLGDYEGAERYLEESLVVGRDLGFEDLLAQSTFLLGKVADGRGEYDRARSYYAKALAMNRGIGSRWLLAQVLEALACIAAAEGRGVRALRLVGCAEAIRLAIDVPLSPPERSALDARLDGVRRELGESAAEAEAEIGRRITPERALAGEC